MVSDRCAISIDELREKALDSIKCQTRTFLTISDHLAQQIFEQHNERTFLASWLIRDKSMNFYTLPHQEVRYKNTLPVGINFTKFWNFMCREVRYMVYLTKRAGKYKILSRVRVIKLLSREAKRSKIPSRAAVGRKGRYFYDLGLKGK